MMRDVVLDWLGAGYDAISAPDHSHVSAALNDGWLLVQEAVAHARRGSGELVHVLGSTIVANTRDVLLHRIACEIVGDAGSAADLERLVSVLDNASFGQRLDIARALASRGRLLDVPVVFGVYEQAREHPDTEILRLAVNWLIFDPDELSEVPDDWHGYRLCVGRRYFDLWNEFGTNLVHIHHGYRFDIQRIAESMLDDLREGLLDADDRHVFEVTTGMSCSAWFNEGQTNYLRAASDLEHFIDSGKGANYPGGQRAFMGYWLEDVAAARAILEQYPPNDGMGVPSRRTTFDQDSLFALEFGFEPMNRGYFFQSPRPPPTAELVNDAARPWLTLQTCLRHAVEGDRTPLEVLASLVKPAGQSIFSIAAIELLADAADDRVIAPWRAMITREEDPEFIASLCWGLLRRGMLDDVPLVLDAYRRHPNHPRFAYLEGALNCLFAYAPLTLGPHQAMGMEACTARVTQCYESVRRKLGRDHVPIFRGGIYDVSTIARELIELRHGPEITAHLRVRFEASTGIDCSDWVNEDHGFDSQRAAETARKFLGSKESASYRPGQLYFFGRPIEH